MVLKGCYRENMLCCMALRAIKSRIVVESNDKGIGAGKR